MAWHSSVSSRVLLPAEAILLVSVLIHRCLGNGFVSASDMNSVPSPTPSHTRHLDRARASQQHCRTGKDRRSTTCPASNEDVELRTEALLLSFPKRNRGLRGGAYLNRRQRAWETAVKRGKGGFPGPTSWESVDEEALRVRAETLLAPEIPDPVIEQFEPTRLVLWKKWRGTMLEDTWGTTLINMGMALMVCLAFRRIQALHPKISEQLYKIDIIWKMLMTLTTFILTFFVSQSYTLWQNVYATTRSLQGRMNDTLMLVTTHLRWQSPCPQNSGGSDGGSGGGLAGVRDDIRSTSNTMNGDGADFTTSSREWLTQLIRYMRLWHLLYYASCSRKHACFCTDSGLQRLHLCGLLAKDELQLLMNYPQPPAFRHMPAFQWMVAFFLKGVAEDRFQQPIPLVTRVSEQFVALRARSGAVTDMVGGRTKLAYAHAVQLLVDVFLLLTPFALFSEVGFWSIAATGVFTTFYQGLFNLSKAFIDPLNNENATIDSDCIVIDSLVKESANMAGRWAQGSMAFPF